jgi:hypothetical protein
LTTSKDEKEQGKVALEAEPKPIRNRIPNNARHSLYELLQVAEDMGDQRMIDSITKKLNE